MEVRLKKTGIQKVRDRVHNLQKAIAELPPDESPLYMEGGSSWALPDGEIMHACFGRIPDEVPPEGVVLAALKLKEPSALEAALEDLVKALARVDLELSTKRKTGPHPTEARRHLFFSVCSDIVKRTGNLPTAEALGDAARKAVGVTDAARMQGGDWLRTAQNFLSEIRKAAPQTTGITPRKTGRISRKAEG